MKTHQPGVRIIDQQDGRTAVTRPARILYVHQRSTFEGGAPTSLLTIVSTLDRKRFEPLVLCSAPGALSRCLEEAKLPPLIRRRVQLERGSVLGFALDVAWYRRWLRREHITLVHMNVVDWRPSVLLAARLRGIPCVQHVRARTDHVRRNFSFAWADRIIAVSDFAGRPFQYYPLLRRKTQTIYNGVDLTQFTVTGRDNRTDIEARKKHVIGFVGRIEPGKGVRVLLEAMPTILRSCSSAFLVIVGCASSDHKDYEYECRRLVRDRNLESHVLFTGFRRDVPEFLRTFDVFALPTRIDMCPRVVIEAMATGCPVVASRVGGIPEIISTPDLGTLVPPDDPEVIAQAIIRYVQAPKLARKVGTAASEHVREHFSLNAMMRKLESVYSELLARS